MEEDEGMHQLVAQSPHLLLVMLIMATVMLLACAEGAKRSTCQAKCHLHVSQTTHHGHCICLLNNDPTALLVMHKPRTDLTPSLLCSVMLVDAKHS